MLPSTTSVAVIGAGPAGLAAALTLARAGVDFVLLDQQAEGANTSRAAVVHARTLEVLEELGVADALRARGIVVPTFTVRDGSSTLATIRFGGLPTAFPYTLMVPQDVTEAVLLERLRSAGGDVHRPYRVTAVTGDGQVTVVDADQNASVLRADYVIGADGAHSSVREQAGIGFTGDTYASSFVLADVRMDWPLAREEVSLHLAPEGVTVVAPLPGDRYRVVATLDQAPERPDAADVQSLLDARGPGDGTVLVREVLWSSRFRIHHRVADRFRAGRIFLAGDAAHVHSPAGGQGMNTGVQDAVALGRLLARVIAGEPADLLDTYEATRRPIAQDVVAFTDRMTRMATLRRRPARALRNTALRTLGAVPAVRTRLAYQLAELANR